MRRRGIFALCLLASIIICGCESTSSRFFDSEYGEFQQASIFGNMRKVARLIKKSTPEERMGMLYATITPPSMWVLHETYLEKTVAMFLEAGIDINSLFRGIPLWVHAFCSNRDGDNSYKITRLLLRKGANVNAVDSHGKSALYHAVAYGRADIVQLLIRYGANVNLQYKGQTLLYIAQIMVYNTSIANLLRKAGAKPTEEEKFEVQEAQRLSAENFYDEVIYRRGVPLKIGDEFRIKKNCIHVLDRTTTRTGYTYLVTSEYIAGNEYVWDYYKYSSSDGGTNTKSCFLIQSKREMSLHNAYSHPASRNYITSVNNLKLTCIGKSQYQQNYQDVECYVFTLDAEL